MELTKIDSSKFQKNTTIEFLRYFFMIILLIWHGGWDYLEHGYLVVEFYFILSGYFLLNSNIRRPKSAAQYTFDKLKRTYFEYFTALCISFLYFGVLSGIVHDSFSIKTVLKIIPEALLIQDIGIFEGGFNSPMWYYSVLIISGYFLYYMINKWRNTCVNFIIPICCIIFFIFLVNSNNGSLEGWGYVNGLYFPFIRGMAEMGLGVLLCNIATSRLKIHNSVMLDIFAIVAFVLVCYILNTDSLLDRYVLILFPFIIYTAIWNKSIVHKIFNHPIWERLGGVSFEMFLLHHAFGGIYRKILGICGLNLNAFALIIYIVLITGCSFAFKKFCVLIQFQLLSKNQV